MSFQNCTAISAACPIEGTTYGYRPELGPNIALLTVFGVLALAQLGLAFIYRLWAFSLVIAAACVLEAVGYGGRIIMHANPWSQTGFRIQIICLIFSPSFLAAAVYLTLKHLVIYFGPEYSRLKPKLYTWIFIGCDIASIFLQAAGGGVAASAGKGNKENAKTADAGNSIMLAGIAFQVATMIVCGLLGAEFFYKLHTAKRPTSSDASKSVLGAEPKALVFCGAVGVAYFLILIRCVYRLPEMSGGWGSPLMRNEAEFLVLDGLMIALATIALTVIFPGLFFPEMLRSKSADEGGREEVNTPEDVEKQKSESSS